MKARRPPGIDWDLPRLRVDRFSAGGDAVHSAGTTRGSSATGFEIVASSPEAFDERIRHDYAIYGNVAKDAGIKPE